MFCWRLRSLNRGSLLCHTCWVCLHFAFGLTEGLPLLQAKGLENLSYTWILCETTFIEKDISITYHIVHIHLNIYLINMYIIHSTDYNFIRCQERFVTITGSKKYVFFSKEHIIRFEQRVHSILDSSIMMFLFEQGGDKLWLLSIRRW